MNPAAVSLLKEGGKLFSNLLLRSNASTLSKTLAPILESATEGAVLNASTDPSSGIGQQKQSLLEALGHFKSSLNGQATEEGHQFLQSVLDKLDRNETLDRETLGKVLEVAQEVEKVPTCDKSGQGLLFDVEPEEGPSTSEVPKPQVENTSGKAEKTDSQPGPQENTASPEEQAFSGIVDNVKSIIRRELLNKSSWIGLAAEIAKTTGVGSIDDVEGFIEKTLVTDDFKAALKNSILGKEVSTEGFSKLQEKAFKVTSWSIWAIDKMPSWSIQYFPMLTTIIKFSMPIWTHIPFLRKPLGTLYPFIDEAANFVGKFQQETESIKGAINTLRGGPAHTLASSENPGQK